MSLLTKEQFEAIVHEFVGELIATFEGQASRPLPPGLAADLADHLALVAEPNLPPEERVAAAFGVVNQYLESTWKDRVQEGFRLYLDLRRAK
jgi:hypothetical protein